ncbi:MAG: hypothetical protein EP330_11375 [Deltaproteobacteria bacterium]|nr:MAG: hypothetical protein EP330_11375 [Deltaproteobacteria bacterium]
MNRRLVLVLALGLTACSGAPLDPDARYADCTATEDIDYEVDGVPEQRREITFDENGREVHWTHRWLMSGTVYVIDVDYDEHGHVTREQFDFGDSVDVRTTVYDGLHALYRETDRGNDGVVDELITYETNGAGQRVSGEWDTDMDGVADRLIAWTWNEDGLSESTTVTEAGGTVWDRIDWTWDESTLMRKVRVLNGYETDSVYSHDSEGRIVLAEEGDIHWTTPSVVRETEYMCP